MDRVERAVDRAFAWALRLPEIAPQTTGLRARRFAIGDPQAPLRTFLGILERKGLLGDDGALAPDVMLVSLGDHFDWGTIDDRARATDEALALLAWLAHHPWDQVVLIAGNHDLGRVGELAGFDDETYVRAREEASVIYFGGRDAGEERAFLARWPSLPTAEVAARDFSAFRAQQRTLVEHLLRARRLRLAWAPDDAHLFSHAGVTGDALGAIGARYADTPGALAIADALNARLDDAVARWSLPAPLEVADLHAPGNAARGEGSGVLYHRATTTKPEDGRRFHPRRLPRGLVQVIGHVRDKKSRELLGLDASAAKDGPLRHLVVAGDEIQYGRGVPPRRTDVATVIYADGGMLHANPDDYELVEITGAGLRAY